MEFSTASMAPASGLFALKTSLPFRLSFWALAPQIVSGMTASRSLASLGNV